MSIHTRDRLTGTDRAIGQYRRFTEYELREAPVRMLTDLLHWYRIYVERTNPDVESLMVEAVEQYHRELAEQGQFAPLPEEWEDGREEPEEDESWRRNTLTAQEASVYYPADEIPLPGPMVPEDPDWRPPESVEAREVLAAYASVEVPVVRMSWNGTPWTMTAPSEDPAPEFDDDDRPF